MSVHDTLMPTYRQMLTALSSWLGKAEANRSEEAANALLEVRLAADMYPLSAQVRFACLQAQEAVFRLRGEAVPEESVQLAESARDPKKRWSLHEAQATIKATLDLLDSAPSSEEIATIEISLPGDMVFDMTAQQYMRDWALPQFYFHLNMAYAILRSEGVELGKADYVPHALAYLRR